MRACFSDLNILAACRAAIACAIRPHAVVNDRVAACVAACLTLPLVVVACVCHQRAYAACSRVVPSGRAQQVCERSRSQAIILGLLRDCVSLTDTVPPLCGSLLQPTRAGVCRYMPRVIESGLFEEAQVNGWWKAQTDAMATGSFFAAANYCTFCRQIRALLHYSNLTQ